MKRSVSAFIFGLIGSIFSLFWGFWCGIIGDAGQLIASSAGEGASEITLVLIFGWTAFIGAIIGIIGASYCFKNAGKGSIILAIATAMCGILQIYLFVNAISAGAFVMTLILILLLPVALMVTGTICAFRAPVIAPRQNVAPINNGYSAPNAQPQTPVSTGKTLEQELTELKRLFDNGILTEEEFATAKKNAIEKYSR